MRNSRYFLEIVASYDEEFRADIARATLAAHRIFCEITVNSSFRWNPFSAKSPETYAVSVKRSDASRARKFLKRS